MPKKKKIVVVGRGTGGSLSAAHMSRWMSDHEVEWHFDPNIPPQAVGEGSTVELPKSLYEDVYFRHEDLQKIDGSFKSGIYKKNWGLNGIEYIHGFIPYRISYHFNALKLQDYILNKLKDTIKIVEVNHEDSESIDADYVLDCSGRPKVYDKHNVSPYIPVNSVYVTQCYWDYARFQYTLTIARPYGWIFGIPLQNRCSIGYLFNKDINSLDEIKEDVKNIFEEYNLTPSDHTNHFSFQSYSRKQNFTDRIAYNGNASFFLEPLEATSIGVIDRINRLAHWFWTDRSTASEANYEYDRYLKEAEAIIMLHYFSGSVFDTEFWKYAKDRGDQCISDQINSSQDFKNIVQYCLEQKNNWDKLSLHQDALPGSSQIWSTPSFIQNIYELQIEEKLKKIL
jgi:hypothetical protein